MHNITNLTLLSLKSKEKTLIFLEKEITDGLIPKSNMKRAVAYMQEMKKAYEEEKLYLAQTGGKFSEYHES